MAGAQDDADAPAMEQAVASSVTSIHGMKSGLIDRSVHPRLQKLDDMPRDDGPGRAGNTRHAELPDLVKVGDTRPRARDRANRVPERAMARIGGFQAP